MTTMRRDFITGADLSTAAVVLEQTREWIADYSALAPHSALGHLWPHEYCATQPQQRLMT